MEGIGADSFHPALLITIGIIEHWGSCSNELISKICSGPDSKRHRRNTNSLDFDFFMNHIYYLPINIYSPTP